MPEYIGSKCISCGEQFKNTDDIVVCPECGTPYHRDCYFKEGKCLNTVLHESGGTWKPDAAAFSGDDETISCPRCGEKNPQTGLFCKKCGTPLNQNSGPNPFPEAGFSGFNNANPFVNPAVEKITPETEIDGIKVKDMSDYVGKNQMYYLPNFVRFGKMKSKFSINIMAMVFPEIYFTYRKMYLTGILLFIFKILVYIPILDNLMRTGLMAAVPPFNMISLNMSDSALESLTEVLNFVMYAVSASCAFFANWIYYRKTVSTIKKVRLLDVPEEQKTLIIKTKGGVSMTIAAGIITLLFIAIMFVFFFMQDGAGAAL
ncbi:MAG: RING finger protein [Oscillospiraceae bacterium]